ncbi:hypothetical protein ACHAP5_011783 [Fusarium lateritium]
MSKLFHRRKRDTDDEESNFGRRASRTRSVADENLGEYPALDRYISTYRDDRCQSVVDGPEGGKVKKKHWWQFGSGLHTEEEPAAKKGSPDSWFDTDIKTGLSSDEVEHRRKISGWNELTSEKENQFAKFLGFFTGPILYVMEVAALLAVGLGDWIDFGVIVGILMLNAFVGYYQERQAADIVASLKGDIAMRYTVVRDSNEQEILARELVPGDILIVQEGDTVAADSRLICDYTRPEDFEVYKRLRAEDKLDRSDEEDDMADGPEAKQGPDGSDEHVGRRHSHEQEPLDYRSRPLAAIDQSAITGESLAVEKYLGDIVYYTTGCKRGKSFGLVQTPANESFVGRTADLVQGAKDQGHFKAIMNQIGTTLLVLVMFWILIAWMSGTGEISTPRDNFKQSSNGWVDIVTVVIIWLYSFGYTVVIAIVYFVLNKVSWLDNLGRENRGKKDTKLENILGHLQKLAVEHEHDDKTGKGTFLLVEKAADEEDDI